MAKKVLVVVDMQNDFIDGALGTKEAVAIVPRVAEKIRLAREAGTEIVFTRDTHGEHYLETQEGRKLPVVHCVKGSFGWEISTALDVEGATVIDKPSFGSLKLADYVAGLGELSEVELVGLCTDICVISNAMILKARLPELPVFVDASCCAGVSPESHKNALDAMRACQIGVREGKQQEVPMNQTIQDMQERRSCRKFKSDMLPKETIDQIINAGLYAANAMGRQATRIVAVTNKELRDKISRDNRKIGGWDEGFDPFYNAPVILIVLAEKDWANRVYDGSLVMGNLMLAAHSLGVGSIWIHRARQEFEMDEYKDLLKKIGLEGEYEGIGHCALGYIDGELAKPAPRKEKHVFYVD